MHCLTVYIPVNVSIIYMTRNFGTFGTTGQSSTHFPPTAVNYPRAIGKSLMSNPA